MSKKEITENSKIGEKYTKIKHDSGCTILLYPMKGYSSVCAVFGTDYGSIDTAFRVDGNKEAVLLPEGIAHYLEHKLFENEDCGVFELFAKTGADCNAFTTFDKTAYYFSCSQEFEKNLEILLDFVQNPYFTDENVQKERGIIAQEIKMYLDDPSWMITFNGLRAVYHNNPVRTDIAGTEESIAKINKELLYRCYDTFYNLNNMTLSIAGNFDEEKALAVCDKMLKKSTDHKLEKIIPDEPAKVRKNYVSAKMSCAQPLFNIMYKFPSMSVLEAERNYIIYNNLFEVCLGKTSKFYTEMYEQGLINETFGAGVLKGRGFFVGIAEGESKEPQILMEKINNELKRLKKEPPDKNEVENIKKKTYGELLASFNNVGTVARNLLSAGMAGISLFEQINIAAEISYKDITDALDRLDLNNCCISVIEPI